MTKATVLKIRREEMPKALEEVFKKAFCRQCREFDACVKDSQSLNICKQLVDRGVWRSHFGRPQDG